MVAFHQVYNSIFECTNNREGAILHPMKDMDIVWLDIQLDTICTCQLKIFQFFNENEF